MLKNILDFFQNEILGMKWLSRLFWKIFQNFTFYLMGIKKTIYTNV